MRDLIGQMIFPFLGCLLLATTQVAAQAPDPAPNQTFALPLSDKTTATAVLLPIDADRMWMVYASPAGKIGFWMMTRSTDPIPPDPIPPPPPEPTKLTIVAVENPEHTTQAQRDVLSDENWRNLAQKKHNFLGILPADLVDKRTGTPPPHLKPFLDRAKLHVLPWIMFMNARGLIMWEGNPPTSGDELEALIQTHGG